ncbi:response regulator [Okeanomitos corallinicola TIOX110]|uniref:Response regulator n=1 Tax=Okeanomitos corallinicola TIOX110 TaxID=3133117 RepID=A0ABZ2UNM4_9CYAN
MTAKSILVIDDEADLGFLISTCLEEFSVWQVLTTDSAHQGLKLAQTEKPDAILLDVMMPEIDGITLFGYLQNNPNTQKIPVIFMTAKVQNSDLELYKSLGVKGVITKPFNPFTLVKRITEILQW